MSETVEPATCPQRVHDQFGVGFHTCGHHVKRRGLCGTHARMVEERERRDRERSDQARQDREHRQEMERQLNLANNLVQFLREVQPDIRFVAQRSAREVVLELDLDNALALLNRLSPNHSFVMGDHGVLAVNNDVEYVPVNHYRAGALKVGDTIRVEASGRLDLGDDPDGDIEGYDGA